MKTGKTCCLRQLSKQNKNCILLADTNLCCLQVVRDNTPGVRYINTLVIYIETENWSGDHCAYHRPSVWRHCVISDHGAANSSLSNDDFLHICPDYVIQNGWWELANMAPLWVFRPLFPCIHFSCRMWPQSKPVCRSASGKRPPMMRLLDYLPAVTYNG